MLDTTLTVVCIARELNKRFCAGLRVTQRSVNRIVPFIAIGLLGACQNDSHTLSGYEYTPSWFVEYDQSRSLIVSDAAVPVDGQIYQCMSVQNALAERALKKSCYRDTAETQYHTTLFRLVASEAFRIATAHSEWQLYRRSAPFVYERSIVTNDEFDYLRLTYDRNSPSDENLVAHINVPNASNALLAEEGQTVAVTSTINLSWEIDTEQYPLASQSVIIRHNGCGSGADAVRHIVSLDIEARSTSIEVGDLPHPTVETNRSCLYQLQLALVTAQQNSVNYVLSTLSRDYPFTVELSPEQSQ